ncbi:MAG TPA: cytochrome c [Flavobacteriaceae bacterium]|nr:cytochrome c [Flavobacteriaceae bacterium]MCB9212267.1 cytochrome c [Alteromonas sp.]HPF10354.1 cytochrome c [Flavobacteriaceae bacterium]HQU20418.1 cytochrome c [Flavobacteriaceae bacterium]HQU65756.1 cytochrome c [Flavobacteriaceae bacterium]
MKNSFQIVVAIAASVLMVSCFNSSRPNYQYMPNMYEPVGYETYGEYEIFPGGQEAMLPAEGTIPRGWQPYEYPNTTDGLNLAKAELKNPLPVTEASLANGKKLYDIYCAVCHGVKGDGQGILVQREKILGIPSYADPGRLITEGGIYHVQMFGLNAMGSYASQTNETERWEIVQHVMNLKASLEGTPLLVPQTEEVAAMPMESEATPSEEEH